MTYVPIREEIRVEYGPGEITNVDMHDGSLLMLKKVGRYHNPTDRKAAMALLEEARAKQILVTGLIYINKEQPSLQEIQNMVETPLSLLQEDRLRPSAAKLDEINASFT